MHRHISNQDLADAIHTSERQLHRLTKDMANQSPHLYVTRIRINHAKELMDKRIYSLKKISELTGFSSEFHLSSTFKKFEGISPSQYLAGSTDPYLKLGNVFD